MIDPIRSERGSAIVTALLVMMIFMGLAFTTLQLVDSQQGESRRERERESSFSLAEGVLNSQIYLLSRQWPGTSGLAYPAQCTKATSANLLCPDSSTLEKSFAGADFNAGLDWTTEIHDNLANSTDPTNDSSQFYDDAIVRQQPRYDSNGDGLVWVRAQSTIRNRRRTVIALIRAERLDALFPRNVLVANTLTASSNGNQTYVNTGGSYVVLRCTGAGGTQLSESSCKDWRKPVQVGPNADTQVIPNQKPGMSPETIARFRETAKANGTYYPGPCAPTLAGAVVFIENAGCGGYNPPGNGEWNSETAPGVLIIGSGTISFSGNAVYNGLIYMVNGSDGVNPQLTGNVITIQGNTCVRGAVVIDGPGGMTVGNSHGANRCDGNLVYNANADDNLKAFGTAGIVQNSFREIVADS